MRAPTFSLPDQDGKITTSNEFRNRWLIVFFYPKDDTPGCTKEACSFRDQNKAFADRNIAIVGISKDSTKSHLKFAKKYNLNFPLLSDEDTDIIKAFGAWGQKKIFGRTFTGIRRNTYLINPDGEIVKVYESVNPLTHVSEILEDISKTVKK